MQFGYLLFAVICLLFAVFCFSFAVRCLLLDICYPLFVIPGDESQSQALASYELISRAPDNLKIDFWENGNVKTINHYCNDTICGDYFEYFKSGLIQISAIKSKSNDKIDNWAFYYENGAIRLTGKKLGDVNIGDWVEYSEDGQILKVTNH